MLDVVGGTEPACNQVGSSVSKEAGLGERRDQGDRRVSLSGKQGEEKAEEIIKKSGERGTEKKPVLQGIEGKAESERERQTQGDTTVLSDKTV